MKNIITALAFATLFVSATASFAGEEKGKGSKKACCTKSAGKSCCKDGVKKASNESKETEKAS
jgi:hypothetical protein